MNFREQTRDVSALDLRAEVTSVDEKNRTFDLVWSTGARVLRNSWFSGPSYEELSMDPAHVRMGRLQSGRAPFLANHDGYDVTRQPGVVMSARVDGGKGHARVRMDEAGQDPDADRLFGKIARGIVRNVSVGYRTYRSEEVDSVGKVPVLRAVDWEPFEISSVSIPADAEAGTRSAETVQSNPCVFVTRDRGEDVEKTEAEKQAEALKAEEAKRALEAQKAEKAKATAQDPEVAQRAAQLERERITGIQHATRAAKLGDKFAAEHVEKNTPLDVVRALALTALAASTDEVRTEPHVPVEVGEMDSEKWVRGASASIFHRSGIASMLGETAEKVKESKIKIPGVRHAFKGFDADDDGGEFRHMSLFDLAREALERSGTKTRGMTKERVVELALVARGTGQATITDFPVLLENVMYKTLLGAYAQQQDTWRRFCGVDSVQDFRPANRYRTGSFGVLPVLGESAEYQSVALPDGAKQQITTETRGQMIAISRQAIINDDMGALTDTAGKFGRMAGLSIEKAVFDLLALNAGLGPNVTYTAITAPLFDAQFNNISTGAALTMAALEADRVKMAQQKDISNNEFLDLRPSSLLVPLSLEGEANVLNRAKFDPTASSAFERPNIVGGLFKEVIGTPRLTGTRRYLFSDQTPALLVVFLNGSQAPMMDQQMGWRVDGVEWKLRIDFKAQGFDPKGALTNAGV